MNTGKPSSETGSNRKGIRLLPVRAEKTRPLRLGERGLTLIASRYTLLAEPSKVCELRYRLAVTDPILAVISIDIDVIVVVCVP